MPSPVPLTPLESRLLAEVLRRCGERPGEWLTAADVYRGGPSASADRQVVRRLISLGVLQREGLVVELREDGAWAFHAPAVIPAEQRRRHG